MKQYRTALLVVFLVAVLAMAESSAQITSEGQPSVLKEDKSQANYVYDLKDLIKKSKDNIKTVNEKIKEQAVVKRNQQREAKAREYYEQGLKLQEEGRFEEARLLFDKAIRITEHPEMDHYINDSARRAKLQQAAILREENDEARRLASDQRALVDRVEVSYGAAVSLYKQQKYVEARDEFKLVEEMMPDYKAVRSYLQIVEQDIAQSEQLQIKEQKKELERQQKDAEIARLREKELWRKEIDKKEEERAAQLRKQAQLVYEEAQKLYNDRQFLAAREKFQQVEWVIPDFKATRAYLTRIENDVKDEKKQQTAERARELEKQRWDEALKEKAAAEERRKAIDAREQARLLQVKDQAEFVYKAAIVLFDKKLMDEAKAKFSEVEGIYPNYKATHDYQKRIEGLAQLQELKKKSLDERRMWEEEMLRRKEEKEKFKQAIVTADDSYIDAVKLYQANRLIEAKEKFLLVDANVPDYKATRSYLKRIDKDIELLAKTQKSDKSLSQQREELEKMRLMREKVEAVYAQALSSYTAKDFATAKAKFLEVNTLSPDYKKTPVYLNQIDSQIKNHAQVLDKMAREKEAEAVYIKALTAYQVGQYLDAKKDFVAVASLVPNYKKTPEYLDRIDDDILRQKEEALGVAKENQIKGVYAQAMTLYAQGDFAQAKERFIEVEVVYPGYKETSRILGNIDADIEKARKDALERERLAQADKFYSKALELYRSGDYVASKEQFIQAEVAHSDYKDTLRFLKNIDADIARVSQEKSFQKTAGVEATYNQALDLFRKLEFAQAKSRFLEVQSISAGYKDTAMYLSRIDKDMADLEARFNKQERMRRADAIYADAVKLYGNRKFGDAKRKFIELASVDPDYKNARMYLARIDKDISEDVLRKDRLSSEKAAAGLYAQAVKFYHDGNLLASQSKFHEVSALAPDFQKTKYYLACIDRDVRSGKVSNAKPASGFVLASDGSLEALYKEAVEAYKGKKYEEAGIKFEAVNKISAGYRFTQEYLDSIKEIQLESELDTSVHVLSTLDKDEAVVSPQSLERVSDKTLPVGTPSSRIKTHTLVDAKAIKSMSARSSSIYRQIKLLSQETIQANPERTYARVDWLIDNLERERQRIAAEVARQKKVEAAEVRKARAEEKNESYAQLKDSIDQAKKDKRLLDDKDQDEASSKQAEMKEKREALKQKEREELERLKDEQHKIQLKAEVFYQRAITSFNHKDYEASRGLFTQAKGCVDNYKDTSRYLIKIDRVQAESILLQEEAKDRAKISEEAAKAAALNVEVLTLSQKKEYEAVEKKLDDLESILKNIQGIKAVMVSRREKFESDWDQKILSCKTDGKTSPVNKPQGLHELEGTPRERAINFFKAGRQLYAAGQYPEARVKFMEAANTDPTYQASLSFVKRIDRILSKKDYELQVEQQERHANDPSSVMGEAPKVADPVRAAKVSQEGVGLYKAKRYREARIKFEELSRVGNPSDQRYAARYTALVDRALRQEKQREEDERRLQEERFIKERQNQAKMEWERGKVEAQRREKQSRDLSGTERDQEVRREQDVRQTEEENAAQRRMMLENKVLSDEAAQKKERLSREKYIHQAKVQAVPMDVKAAKNKEDEQKIKGSKDDKLQLTDKVTEASTKSKLDDSLNARNRRHLDLLESEAQKARRLKEEEARRRVAKQEAQKRKITEKWVKEQKAEESSKALSRRISQEKAKFEADTDTDAFVRRNKEAVEAILKEVPPVSAPLPMQPVVVPASIIEEKNKIDTARAQIRKDLEAGVDRIYSGAIVLYKKKLYADAKADFLQVNTIIKDYKKTNQYIKEIDRLMGAADLPINASVIAGRSANHDVTTTKTPVIGIDRKDAVLEALDAFDVNVKN